MSSDFEKKLEIVHKIQKDFSNCMVGGSFVLNHFNVINREIGDLDIIIPQEYKNDALIYFKQKSVLNDIVVFIYEKFLNLLKVNDGNNKVDNHIKIKYDNIKLCLFFVDYNDGYRLNINDKTIRICKIDKIIDAKQHYIDGDTNMYPSKSISKHMDDIKLYEKKKKIVERQIKCGIIVNDIVEIKI